MRLFGWLATKPKPAPATASPALTPRAVEAMIDAAGRDEVFARAAEGGWGRSGGAPLWVWAAIANEILAAKAATRVTIH